MTEAGLAPHTLYVVGTPIGNLKDWSVRAQEVLAEVDLILAEDTRVTGLLCHHAGIHTPFLSFHAHNTQKRIPEVLSRLSSDTLVALVSDRGMPGISDPGQELIDAVWEAGLTVSVIPGPSALDTAFVASGFPAPVAFWGFLPRTGLQRRQALKEVSEWSHTAVIYEAPHHLSATLGALEAELGAARELFLAREMTKRFEEYWRGPLRQWHELSQEWRGEYVLVIGPENTEPERLVVDWNQLVSRVDQLVQEGQHPTEAIRRIARESNVSRRELYGRIHNR